MAHRCYVPIIVPGGYTLGIAVDNEPGYYQTDYEKVATYEAASDWADKCNESMGVTREDRDNIMISSMALQNAS